MFGVQALEVIDGSISVKLNIICHFVDASGVGYDVVYVRFVQMCKL